jgi:hypothetical protein
MRFPAYGNSLWQRRLMGERPRVVALLVGGFWRMPKWLSADIPRVAVKTASWSDLSMTEKGRKLALARLKAPSAIKEQARSAVHRAVKNGSLLPTHCQSRFCMDPIVEAHHSSYAKADWLDVRWFCRHHHDAEHARLKTSSRDTLDWRVVAEMTVLAIDVRDMDERVETSEGWDEWLWLLSDVQRYARDVMMFTPSMVFDDPPNWFAPERTLEVFAWLNRKFDTATGCWSWPDWWPYGEQIFLRESA